LLLVVTRWLVGWVVGCCYVFACAVGFDYLCVVVVVALLLLLFGYVVVVDLVDLITLRCYVLRFVTIVVEFTLITLHWCCYTHVVTRCCYGWCCCC